MTTVNSLIYVNPIEPAPMSMRVPAGLETRVALSFYNQLGNVIATDLRARLRLAPRSGGSSLDYLALATDVANGKALAVIPPGTLVDGNGYHLNLYGTLFNETMLLASGVVTPIATASGMDDLLSDADVDTVDRIDIVIWRNQPCTLLVRVWADDGKSLERDLSSVTVLASVYTAPGAMPLASFIVTKLGGNDLQLDMSEAEVATLPSSGWWSLLASVDTGFTTWAEGTVTVMP